MINNDPLEVIFFDINGVYEEDSEQDEKLKNKLESPLRILNQYTSEKFFADLDKDKDQEYSEKLYKFTYEFENNDTKMINCHIINNFSFGHTITHYANGYVIFFNIDNNTSTELEKLINYISDDCSRETRIYIIGVYEKNTCKNREQMTGFLDDYNIDYIYYEMYGGDKQSMEKIKKSNPDSIDIEEVFKNIFEDIYETNSKSIRKIKKISKNPRDERNDVSGGCNIF